MVDFIATFVDKNRKFIRIFSASFYVVLPGMMILLGVRRIADGPILFSLLLAIGIGVLSYLLKRVGPIIGFAFIFLGTVLIPIISGLVNEMRYRMGGYKWLDEATLATPFVVVFRSIRYIILSPTSWASYLVFLLSLYVTAVFVGFALLVFYPDKSLARKDSAGLNVEESQTSRTDIAWTVAIPGQQEKSADLAELRGLIQKGVLGPQSTVRDPINNQYFSLAQIPGLYSRRSYTTALLISFFLGNVGVDRFYLGQTGLGIAKLLTLGGCGVWGLIDFILIALRKVTDNEGLPLG